MSAPNAASGSLAMLPVVDGDDLLIEVLEHDPELPCIHDHGMVATHLLVAPSSCSPHPLCLVHAEAQAAWLREQPQILTHWECILHGGAWVGYPDQIFIQPLRRREAVA